MDILAQTIELEPTGDGNIPEGFLYALFKNIGTVATSVNGVNLNVGEAKDYPFVGKGYPMLPFELNGVGAALRILYVI